MDPTPLQRRVTFGLIVIVLAGLAAYLISTAARGSAQAAAARAASPPAATPSTSPVAPVSIASPAGPVAAASPDIYQWLPFTAAGLAAAASVTREFGAAYGTFSYTENAAAYAAPLKPLAAAQLVSQIAAAYAVPGVAAARSAGKQVSAGTASIQSLRSFGPTSLTFVVQITENLTSVAGRTRTAIAYAVTVAGGGTTWRVTDVELANAGNS